MGVGDGVGVEVRFDPTVPTATVGQGVRVGVGVGVGVRFDATVPTTTAGQGVGVDGPPYFATNISS